MPPPRKHPNAMMLHLSQLQLPQYHHDRCVHEGVAA
jgi:hypothetical protein